MSLNFMVNYNFSFLQYACLKGWRKKKKPASQCKDRTKLNNSFLFVFFSNFLTFGFWVFLLALFV